MHLKTWHEKKILVHSCYKYPRIGTIGTAWCLPEVQNSVPACNEEGAQVAVTQVAFGEHCSARKGPCSSQRTIRLRDCKCIWEYK